LSEVASGFDVKEFMDKYTKTTGYPLISIESTSNPTEFKVSQQRFLSGEKKPEGAENQLWFVIIIFIFYHVI
jgi:aminopeptidase N